MEICETRTDKENDIFLSDLSKRSCWILLCAVLLFSLFLQVYKIDKLETEPDEEYIVLSSLLFIEGYKPFFCTGYAMTGTWLYTVSLNAGLIIPHLGELKESISAGKIKDALKIISQSRSSFFTNMVNIHNKLRWINALAVVGAALFVYLISFRLTDSRLCGIFSALFFGISPLMVRWGTDFHPEQFMGLFGAGCLYFCIGHVMNKGKNQWIWASLFAGLAFSSKINAGSFWIPLAVSVYFGSSDIPPKKRIISIFYCTAIMLLTYLVMFPFLFNDPAQFFKNIFTASDFYKGSGMKSWMDSGVVTLLRNIFRNGGFVISVLAVTGAVFAFYKRSLALSLIPISLLSFILLHIFFTVLSERHTLTLIPLTSALAGTAICCLPTKLKYRSAVMTLILIVALIQPALRTRKLIEARSNGDTRTLARNWVYKNVPAESKVLLTYHAPRIYFDRKSIEFWKSNLADRLTKNRQEAFPVEFLRDTVLSEERYYYKKFCYLSESVSLPEPGYDVFELGYIPETVTATIYNDDFWVLETLSPNEISKATNDGNLLTMKIKERGKLAAEFPNTEMMGAHLYIYRVDSSPQDRMEGNDAPK